MMRPGALGSAEFVSASLADAELLAVPDRLDGAGAALRDLPGALPALPREPRPGEHLRAQGVGLRRRRRDGRARIARRAEHRGTRGTRQPGVRRQLQSAAARRSGARQRFDHPGTRRSLRRRGLERDQAAVGQRLGPAVRARHADAAAARLPRDGRRRVPDLSATDGRFNREHFFNKYPGAARS